MEKYFKFDILINVDKMEKYFIFEIKKFYFSSGRPQAPLFTTEQAVSRLSETQAPVFFWEKTLPTKLR